MDSSQINLFFFLLLLLDFQFIISESSKNDGDIDFRDNHQEGYPGDYDLTQEDELKDAVVRTQRSPDTGFIKHARFYGSPRSFVRIRYGIMLSYLRGFDVLG